MCIKIGYEANKISRFNLRAVLEAVCEVKRGNVFQDIRLMTTECIRGLFGFMDRMQCPIRQRKHMNWFMPWIRRLFTQKCNF